MTEKKKRMFIERARRKGKFGGLLEVIQSQDDQIDKMRKDVAYYKKQANENWQRMKKYEVKARLWDRRMEGTNGKEKGDEKEIVK